MDGALRNAAVAGLVDLGRSHDYRDRSDAGRALASFAEMPEAASVLLELVLDPGDTFVTRSTAVAVLRRKDPAGLRIVAEALPAADDSHEDWIHTAVADVFGVFADDRDEAVRVCEELVRDSREQVSTGARKLLDMLSDVTPSFYPV